MLFQFITLVILLLLSATFSGSETAIFNLRAHQRQQLLAAPGLQARCLGDLLRRPDQLLVTLLLANLAVNIFYFASSSVLVLELSERLPRAAAAAVGFAPLVALILMGEVLPKVIALSHAQAIAGRVAPLLWLLERIVRPIGQVLNGVFTRPAIRLLAPARPERAHLVGHDELAAAMEASASDGLIDRQTGELLREVVELKAIRVREVMVPRVDLKAFDIDATRERFLELIRETGFKRLPVYRGDLDNIIGEVDVRAVLLAPDKPVASFVRQIHFVPDVISIAHLLAEFRRRGLQSAVVVDEYGGTAGFVTLEDLVEQIVGDIYDPIDRPANPLVRTGENEYRVAGDLSTREWSRIFGLPLQPHAVHTIAGLIAALLGREPRVGDTARFSNLTFTVEEVHRHRVTWASVRLTDPDAAAREAGRVDS